ncbi:hypothetical protein [Mycobacterium montefiorense]|uniref:hypothetical protein n=1 Tax=Mycobacterium montefiorense TaxID=154654 RepID=UPI0021DE8F0D|nr:hypothetical protein [Mycobacterium montefiorense]MCV7427594.1 hypothetical protein [Mycobacterium montefiorense]GLE50650.1 hypothetical protein ATCCBAA256_02380 [Mycobacterium montefiorense]
MKSKLARVSAALLGCTATIMFSAGVANADPPDPHQPDLPSNYCEGQRFMGNVCDGTKYPDGSFWHQWSQSTGEYGEGPRIWHFDCVSGNEPFPALPPPGGCDGAIPPA